MGRVYLARSEAGRTVAIKVVHDGFAHSPEFRRRFAQEVESARKVGGTWTAPVLDADTECSTPWVAIGYVPGPDLHTVVSGESGPLPVASVLALANGLARALGDIHGAGLLHRDLKPSNVLLTVDGPRVIDFGIARALETPVDGFLTRTGAVIGSPGFMSPEQVRGERRLTPASDVFCLGAVLHYAATRRTPFGALDSGAHALMFRIAEEEADLTGLPDPLVELVRKCLRKDPRERPATEAIATGTELWSPDARPDWLPAGLLGRLGSQVEPDELPQVEADEQPQVEPDEQSVTEPVPEAVPEPEPRDGEVPEGPAQRTWISKPRRRLALATGLLVLIGAGVALAPLLSEGEKAGDKKDGKPGQTASATPPDLNDAAFAGTWSGEVMAGAEKENAIQFVNFTITDGNPATGNKADFILQYPERVCLGHVNEMGVVSGQAVVAHYKVSASIEGIDSDNRTCLPNTQTLTLKGDVLEWRAGDSTTLLRRDTTEYSSDELTHAYKGTWKTSDTVPSMGLSISDLRPGALIQFTGGEGANSCAVSAGVTEITPDRVFGAVTEPTAPDIGICHGHTTFDIRPAGDNRLRILTKRGTPYLFTRTEN